MDQDDLTREEQLSRLASQFAEYLRAQTGIDLPDPETVPSDELDAAFSRLDAALQQIGDLAVVYGSDPRADYEPLVLPSAALAGEYLRAGAGARWLQPEVDGDTTALLATADGVAVDLTGAVRATMLTGFPNLRGMVDRLLHAEEPESS